MSFKVNKVNRIFKLQVRLYFNSTSFNRVDVDATPRYYLKANKLMSIERMALTNKAESEKNYHKYGNRLLGGKQDFEILDSEVEAIFSEIQQGYPYGFNPNDVSSKNKYTAEVWQNDAFQGHYKAYWQDHLDGVVTPMKEDAIQHPYIEFYVDEPIRSKHIKGIIPSFDLSDTPMQYTDFRSASTYTSRTYEVHCNQKVIDVSIQPTGEWDATNQVWVPTAYDDYEFSMDGVPGGMVMLNASGTMYVFRFTDPWPVDENDVYLPFDFRVSETHDGENTCGLDGDPNVCGVEWTDGYNGVIDHETVTYAVTVAAKDYTHPYDGQGSVSGFLLDGVQGQGVPFKRGSKYVFDQSDPSNVGHNLFVASGNAIGADEGWTSYCEVLEYEGTPGSEGAKTTFRVPWDAPDNLYYSCEAHAYMGGDISVNAPAVSSDQTNSFLPGEALKFSYPINLVRETTSYYSNAALEMGGPMLGRDLCVQKCPYDRIEQDGGGSAGGTTYM